MPTEHLTLNVNQGAQEGESVYQLLGPLTVSTLFDFQTAVRADKSPTLILDLTGVPYIDSAGLGSVVNAHVSCANAGKKFAIVGMSERVRALFQLTRVESVLPIFGSLDEAEKHFSKTAQV